MGLRHDRRRGWHLVACDRRRLCGLLDRTSKCGCREDHRRSRERNQRKRLRTRRATRFRDLTRYAPRLDRLQRGLELGNGDFGIKTNGPRVGSQFRALVKAGGYGAQVTVFERFVIPALLCPSVCVFRNGLELAGVTIAIDHCFQRTVGFVPNTAIAIPARALRGTRYLYGILAGGPNTLTAGP